MPSPYTIHDPRHGRGCWLWPLFIIIIEGAWFGISVYGPHHAEVVDPLPDLRKDLAHFESVLPVLLPGERRAHQVAGGELGLGNLVGKRLAVELVERGFSVEGVDLREAAVEIEKMTCLALPGKCGFLAAMGLVPTADSAARALSPIATARPSDPRPPPMRCSASRRVATLEMFPQPRILDLLPVNLRNKTRPCSRAFGRTVSIPPRAPRRRRGSPARSPVRVPWVAG